MAAKKGLKFQGKPVELASLLGVEGRLVATLEALPEDEVFTYGDIADRSKINPDTLQNAARKPRFGKFRYRLGRRTFWGRPVAIAELRRRTRGDN